MLKPIVSFSKRHIVYLHHNHLLTGILLLIGALVALAVANSPLSDLYDTFLHTKIGFVVGEYDWKKDIFHWVNDALMAIFFFLIGLELKQQLLYGELNQIKRVTFPLVTAIGGMVVPAIIYITINFHDKQQLNGWAIPTATDIAFALGMVSILGRRIPIAGRALILALAIFDDLGAIMIIAIFYVEKLNGLLLLLAAMILGIMLLLNRAGIHKTNIYMILSVGVWLCISPSGIHATIAGVLSSLCFPTGIGHRSNIQDNNLINQLHKRLTPWVDYVILPLFAFCNAGISLANVDLSMLTTPLASGIILGLVVGKPVGILLFGTLGSYLGLCERPQSITLRKLLGLACFCGIGFTMSLFIGDLAFDPDRVDFNQVTQSKLSILIASCLSGVLGFMVLVKR